MQPVPAAAWDKQDMEKGSKRGGLPTLTASFSTKAGPCVFTREWLEEINGNRAGAPLHTCLVATENGITPLPWSKIATPEFIDKPKAGADSVPAGTWHGPAPETAAEPAALSTPVPQSDIPVPYGNVAGTIPGCKVASRKSNQGRYPGLIKVDQTGPQKKPAMLAMPSLYEIISQNLEGEYVDLLELSQEQLDLLSRSLPPARPVGPTGAGAKVTLPWANGGLEADAWPCGGALSSEEGPCTPCLGRKLSQEPGPHGPRCRHRDSYLAALQNPVSFGPGLMAAILEEPDGPSPGPEPPPATHCETPAQHGRGAGSPTVLTRRPRRASPGAQVEALVRQGSPRLPSGSSHKFSFLKGPRLGAAPGDERATSQHEGAWKKMSAIYSPRMGRAKPAGKGTDAAATAPVEERSLESTSCKNGPSIPNTGSPGREPLGWQDLHAGLLHSGIVCLPGSSDRLGRALLQVTTSGSAWGAAWCSAAELGRLILYLYSLPRREAKDGGLTVVVDARKQPPAPVLFSALRSVQSISPGCIHTVLLLAEKELVAHRERLPGVQDAAVCIERHQDLMRRVLSDPQLVHVQREGGAVLARLRREATRLGASANIRTSMESAEGLYSQLEEELHNLVSHSNSCLEHLEFLQKVRELEAEFGKHIERESDGGELMVVRQTQSELLSSSDLVLETWDLQCERNGREHRTAQMGCQQLVVRRGQPFTITLHFSGRSYEEGVDKLAFNVETEDTVFLREEDERCEYVLSQEGLIYQGARDYITSTPWNFGQVRSVPDP
ncbi:hypothetical protein llap_15351 [Limosa lapponica baueri]|uniref:Transglutaminase N-terminal domain-containing protein n=1 Tax=Limosa lapponica baueri TaxID=1758121 RepID=A0A2I0TKP7_LIMLA|nr:hypothetical protein llap_15351 [Limosa lapponica baueri]